MEAVDGGVLPPALPDGEDQQDTAEVQQPQHCGAPQQPDGFGQAATFDDRDERDADEDEANHAVRARAGRRNADDELPPCMGDGEEGPILAGYRLRQGDPADQETQGRDGDVRKACQPAVEHCRVGQRPRQEQEGDGGSRTPKTRATVPAANSGNESRSMRHTQNMVESRAGRASAMATAPTTSGMPTM